MAATACSDIKNENIADRKREFVQTYTGETIAAGNIPSKYQSPILLLAMAETLSLMGLKGADVASFSLGDLSVNKGQGGNLQASSEMFERRAMEELQKVGRKVNFYKALG